MATNEERLARLEEQARENARFQVRTESAVAGIVTKLDQLLELATLGRGALRTILRLGAIVIAIMTAIGVLGFRLHWPFGSN